MSAGCPTLNWLLLPLFVIVTVVNVGVTPYVESTLLFALMAAFTLAHIHTSEQGEAVQTAGSQGLGWDHSVVNPSPFSSSILSASNLLFIAGNK